MPFPVTPRCTQSGSISIFALSSAKQDICCHFGSCIIFKCSIRKSYCSHKLCPFSQILSDSRICLIKCSLCGDYCNHASRSYLVKCFCKEIIVDTEVILVVLRIKYLIIPKWHISDNHIKKLSGYVVFSNPVILILAF